jgi:hypothetical protein
MILIIIILLLINDMEHKCIHYPWSAIDDTCPDCDKKTKCHHYPWTMIGDICNDCENANTNFDSNSFFCNKCDGYTKHITKYTNIFSCVKCNDSKFFFPINNSMILVRHDTINDMYNQTCKNCFRNNNFIQYTKATFHCNINSNDNICMDTNRPLCKRCHELVCCLDTHFHCSTKNVMKSKI